MFHNRPIIGLAGGIGSGKSYVAGLFAELGCVTIDADAAVRALYRHPAIIGQIRQWWGEAVLLPDGSANRSFIAKMVFANDVERRRLEQLLHPLVADARVAEMSAAMRIKPDLRAFIWDIPLLFENGLAAECDATVYIDAPLAERVARVAKRGWTEADLILREKTQWGLDKKRQACKYMVVNTAEHAGDVCRQVGTTLSRILEISPGGSSR